MAWMKMLSDTYDAYAHLAGEEDERGVLPPLSHSTVNAQLEVTVDYEGNIQKYGCNIVPKGGKEKITVIPVTEDSASRGNGVAPHPLCDKLCYVAGDYSKYTGEDKRKYYEAYIQKLQEWADSEYSHPMVEAIYSYLKKGCLIEDLLDCGLLELDQAGRLSDKVNKLHNFSQTGAVVRFRVSHPEAYGELTEVWKNHEVYQKYIEYYGSLHKKKELCYVTGEVTVRADKHMAKVRNGADRAKLISANDDTNFTYLGRFTDKSQALSVGYETSQKAHLALRWLLQKQGYTRDGAAMVVWCIKKKVPNILENSLDAYDGIWDEGDDTGEVDADKFNKAIQGYASRFEEKDKVMMIALDAATAGRMSVSYYREFGANEYIRRVVRWHNKCSYEMFVKDKEGNRKNVKCAPAPREIALAAFGIENDREMLEGNAQLIQSTILKILPCILSGREETVHVIPYNIIKAVVSRVSKPESYKEGTWDYIRRIACALLKYDKFGGEDKNMSLENERNEKDRDYLFGRLFAVLEIIEDRGSFRQNGERAERMPVIKRYWSMGVARPAKTFKNVYEKILYYEEKLTPESRNYFENLLQEIIIKIDNVNGFNNTPLGPRYIVGYSIQRAEFMKKESKVGGNEDE